MADRMTMVELVARAIDPGAAWGLWEDGRTASARNRARAGLRAMAEAELSDELILACAGCQTGEQVFQAICRAAAEEST